MNKRNWRKVKNVISRASPTVLSCVAIGGVGVSIYETFKETKKAIRIIDDAEEKKGEELTFREKIMLCKSSIIKVGTTGAVTCACIAGANILNKKQYSKLLGIYEGLRWYHKHYVDENDQESDYIIRKSIASDYVEENPEIIDQNHRFIFFDNITGRAIVLSLEEIKAIETHANNLLLSQWYVSKTDLYEIMGLYLYEEELNEYDNVGWCLTSESSRIEFSYPELAVDSVDYSTYLINIATPECPNFEEVRDSVVKFKWRMMDEREKKKTILSLTK